MQQQETSEIFKAHGFNVINFPCIEITELDSKTQALQQLKQVKSTNVIIFSSQNAVRHAFLIYPDWKISEQSTVIAIGTKTAECLEQNSPVHIWVPEKQNSQGAIELLKGLKKLNSISLITAANGRELIQNFAKENNVPIQQINVYQRKLPQPDYITNQIIAKTENLYILATSVSTLVNLQKLLSEETWNKIKSNKLICASERITFYAKGEGFSNVLNVNTANPEKIANILTPV